MGELVRAGTSRSKQRALGRPEHPPASCRILAEVLERIGGAWVSTFRSAFKSLDDGHVQLKMISASPMQVAESSERVPNSTLLA
jgi:hypothetical protein